MKRIFSNKWFWIAVAVLVALSLVLVFLYVRELFKPLLWAVLIVGLLWILTEVGLRAWQKRKRKAFDEGLTAKEGIEDRKRERELVPDYVPHLLGNLAEIVVRDPIQIDRVAEDIG